ncbi:hypothetical protein Tco_0633468 [Tanacetum coccineum]
MHDAEKNDQIDLLKDTRSAFLTPDSPQDKPIIVSDESEEEETKKQEDTHATSYDIPDDTSVPHPPSQKLASKFKTSHDFAICLPNALKELPSKFTDISGEIKELKKHVAELKNIHKELPAKFQALPSQVSSVQEKLKTLDSLLSLLNKVTDTLNRFATMVENALGAACNNVPSAGQASASPAEGEKNFTCDV